LGHTRREQKFGGENRSLEERTKFWIRERNFAGDNKILARRGTWRKEQKREHYDERDASKRQNAWNALENTKNVQQNLEP
jgi:hypothetical protein